MQRPLEKRLFFSYLGAFATVIAVFALAVRFSFTSIIEAQMTERLATLARAGTAAVLFTRDGFTVDSVTFGGFDVHPDTEGLQWFDPHGRLKLSRGRVPPLNRPPNLDHDVIQTRNGELETYTTQLRDLQGNLRGYVRASQTMDTLRQGAAALDIGLILAAIIAVAVAGLGGAALAGAAVARTEAGYERLREFTADASHELRSPLTALSTTTAVALSEDPTLSARTRHRLTTISNVVDEMRQLVDDLLILARAGRSMEREMFVVHLDRILEDLHQRYRPIALARDIGLEMQSVQPFQIIGNPEQVGRILTNLLDNALRYTPRGGRVRVAFSRGDGKINISVQDTGVGIPPEQADRVFDRFWRATNVRTAESGTGLGLAIARALAERHGGSISVASKLGAGSTFTVSLPARPPSLA